MSSQSLRIFLRQCTNTVYQPEDVFVQHHSPHDVLVQVLHSVLLSHQLPEPARHDIATVDDTVSTLTMLYN